jgi:predicted metalloprotease with PDZ domain
VILSHPRGRTPFAVFIVSIILFFPPPGRATISYTVSMTHPEQHVFRVAMQIPEVHDGVTVQMPAWNALYQIRDFSSHLQRVEAFSGSAIAPIEKLDKQTWRITASGTVSVHYSIYWDEPGPYATQLNSGHAFINPAMILLYVPARRSEAVSLTFPDVPVNWNVASSHSPLSSQNVRPESFAFAAASYDALADAPIEAGKFEEFTLAGFAPPVRIVIHGDNWKKKHVEDDLRRICRYELNLMGGAPYGSFTFIFHIGKAAIGTGGGMEHANSTAIDVPSDSALPSVSAHEFFHLWNVKRIRAASMEPIDYSKEQYSRSLWFAEGVTSTYASYALVRTGLWNKQQFYLDLGAQINDLELRPAEHWQSAEQSSMDAWLEKYSLYNQPQSSVSYYTKGQILGLLLDILIRDHTNNSRSLDDVLRAMNEDFAKQGKFYRDSLDIQLTAQKVAGSSFELFFQNYVAGTQALPYQEILSLAGLQLKTSEHSHPTLGFVVEHDSDGAAIVRSVAANSPAAKAGLLEGDVVVKWNGGDVPEPAERWASNKTVHDTLHLRVRRSGQEITLEFPLARLLENYYEISEDHHATEKAVRIRDGLLRGTTPAEPPVAK